VGIADQGQILDPPIPCFGHNARPAAQDIFIRPQRAAFAGTLPAKNKA
jgi:hypothetical protein